jgi:hypothetical protein
VVSEQALVSQLGLADQRLVRGIVTAAPGPHYIVRVRHGDEEWVVTADLVQASETPVVLQVNDHVLCLIHDDDRSRGVILGRLGMVPAPVRAEVKPPDTIVIEANRSLTLRVGDGSITIREDGKILIKGKDLVSHATRNNRIKGGSVQIN